MEMNDKNGCTLCIEPGCERYQFFRFRTDHRKRVQYDYRHTDGCLFSCIAPDLQTARTRRDEWILKH